MSFLDVREDRRRAGERNHLGRRAECEGRTDDRVARSDPFRHQWQQERVGAARTGDGVTGAAERRQIGFDGADLRPRMNWQWSSTRASASSIARPNRRRWAATSMNGMGAKSARAC